LTRFQLICPSGNLESLGGNMFASFVLPFSGEG
jgi:hypothetical protein